VTAADSIPRIIGDTPTEPAPGRGKPWTCPNGHELGYMARYNRVMWLHVYRLADKPERGVVSRGAGMREVRCSECDEWQEWHMPVNYWKEMLRKRGIDMTVEELTSPIE
jgi:hypothetical protein